MADSLAATLRRLGFEVAIERFDVYLPHPRSVSLSLVAPQPGPLDVRQSGRSQLGPADSVLLLGWSAYSATGVAEAPVVYANYGRREDYAALARPGVGVRDRIVLVRNGRSFRGVKVAEAEARGAAAVVLYSDPADNGFAAGDTVPYGPMLPGGAIQLGTVSYLWRHTGDPLTPGRPSLPGVPRLDPRESTVLPRIPVVPLGYAAARQILQRLEGATAPPGFQGGLPLEYRAGPGPAVLRLEVQLDHAARPIRNVIARLPARDPDAPLVVLGNHFDAWIWGGVDPHTGTTALLEIARGLSALIEYGWRPRREIVLAFWDAEEMNVAGSTEWVEAHSAELQERAVAYFNVDVFTAGTLDVAGSPQLIDVVAGAAEAVMDPQTGRPLAEAWLARQGERARVTPAIGDLGAGSDWTAFWHWAGIPSLQWTMNGRGSWAAYHSAFDDYPYYRDFADSAFVMTPAFARAMGVAALRLSQADGLPYRYTRYADRIEELIEDLERVNLDPSGRPRLPLDTRPLREALDAFRGAAERVETEQVAALAASDEARLAVIDERLRTAERALLDERGLTGRSWYRHTIYAPDAATGYDPLPLPAATEALRAGDPAALAEAVERIAAAVHRATCVLAGAGRLGRGF